MIYRLPALTTPFIGNWQAAGFSGGGGTETGAFSPHDSKKIFLNSDMGCVFLSHDNAVSWQMIPFQQLHACTACRPAFHPIDPDVIYAACGYFAELRVSHDGGRTWRKPGATAPRHLRCILADPLRPQRVLAGHEGGLSVSEDDAHTWRRMEGINESVKHIYCSRADGGHELFAVTPEALYRAERTEMKWRPVYRFPQERKLVEFAAGSGSGAGDLALYLWLSAPCGFKEDAGLLMVSGDAGLTWRPAAMRLADSPGKMLALGNAGYLLANDAARHVLYIIMPYYSASDCVWRSNDQGATWRPLLFSNRDDPRMNVHPDYISVFFKDIAWNITHAALDPSDPEHLMLAHYCCGFITDDGGKSWQSMTAHPAPGQEKLDARSRWLNNGLTITTTWNYDVDPFDPDHHIISYTDIGMATSNDGGVSWVLRRDLGVNTYQVAFDPARRGRIWAALGQKHDIPCNNVILGKHGDEGFGAVARSDDGGATWLDLVTGQPLDEANAYKRDYGIGWEERRSLPPATVISVIIDPASPIEARTLYASLWQRGIYRSQDGGATWEKRSNGLEHDGLLPRCLRLVLHRDGSLFTLLTTRLADNRHIREGVGLYCSRDAGGCWKELTGGIDVRWVTDFTVDPRDSRVIYLSAADHAMRLDGDRESGEFAPAGGLYKTDDGGASWKRMVRFTRRHFAATLHPTNPDWIYVTVHGAVPEHDDPPPEAGLWLSRDRGVTWLPFRDYPFGNPCRVHFHPQAPGIIYVTSFGGSVYRGPAEP